MNSASSLRRRLRLRDLEMLVVIDDTRNLNRAALHLHTSQPALSRNLAQLESVLQATLFDRTSRGMTPTLMGSRLIGYARQCLATLDRAADDLTALGEGGLGHVTVGTNYSSAAYLLPHAIRRLNEVAPRVQVTVREGAVDSLLEELRARRLDIVIARLGSQAYEAAFATELLFDEPMCVVCGPQHPLVGRTDLQWHDLLAWPWILPPRHTPFRDRLGVLLQEAGMPWPESRVESASILVNTNLLLGTPVLSITPRAVARQQSTFGLVHQLPFDLPNVMTPVGLITLRDQAATSAQERLVECIRDVMQHLDLGGN